MNPRYQPLLTPLTLRCGVKLNNRILMAPMTTWSGQDDGQLSDGEIAYYQRRSPGLGAVITACGYVSPQGKGFPGQFSLHSDEYLPGLTHLANTIRQAGTPAIVQIYHGGRMCPPNILPDAQPLSASNIPAEHTNSHIPRAMTETEILSTITAFGEATRRLIQSGFDGVEIHGANGYLLQQFFSPHANRRSDSWGGNLEKRLLFPLSIVDEVIKTVRRQANFPFAVGYRLSPEEIETPGITFEDTLQLVDALATRDLDYLHISTMNFWGGSLRDLGDKRPRAQLIHERIAGKLPIIAVGSICTPEQALQVLETGLPLVALGRELLMEPDWLSKIQTGQEDQIRLNLSKQDQQKLVLPDNLWQILVNAGNWVPFTD